ncbi:MAG: hypothetical protein J6U44_02460 [Paludibacteraceae bacterium]|nr:hypothetical protein [Paludibacteraceae bacterium]
MKKSFLKWAGMAFLAVCVASCDKQSELTLEDIKAPGSSVSVSGYVEIKTDWKWNDDLTPERATLKDAIPAVGITVILELPNSSFDAGASGNQILTTTTNEDGVYSFNVTINPNKTDNTAKIIIPQFTMEEGTYFTNPNDEDSKEKGILFYEVEPKKVDLASYQDKLVPKFLLEPTVY